MEMRCSTHGPQGMSVCDEDQITATAQHPSPSIPPPYHTDQVARGCYSNSGVQLHRQHSYGSCQPG